jgi:hypothetical protein
MISSCLIAQVFGGRSVFGDIIQKTLGTLRNEMPITHRELEKWLPNDERQLVNNNALGELGSRRREIVVDE